MPLTDGQTVQRMALIGMELMEMALIGMIVIGMTALGVAPIDDGSYWNVISVVCCLEFHADLERQCVEWQRSSSREASVVHR